jgi:hypothetical protein
MELLTEGNEYTKSSNAVTKSFAALFFSLEIKMYGSAHYITLHLNQIISLTLLSSWWEIRGGIKDHEVKA